MSKISPTPWRKIKSAYGIRDARGRPIADFSGPQMSMTSVKKADEMIKANMTLVLAAPDLQAALHELIARIEYYRHADENLEEFLCPELLGARAALAKSEGKMSLRKPIAAKIP